MDDRSYQFYVSHDLAEYSGKWVAIVDEKVVASGDNAKTVYDDAARNCPGRRATLAKVPNGEILVL